MRITCLLTSAEALRRARKGAPGALASARVQAGSQGSGLAAAAGHMMLAMKTIAARSSRMDPYRASGSTLIPRARIG